MRGHKNRQQALFYTINLEAMVRQDHPLRVIKKLGLSEPVSYTHLTLPTSDLV